MPGKRTFPKARIQRGIKNLHEELTAIKLSFTENITSSTDLVAGAVKILHSDINTLLEHGTKQFSNCEVEHETRNMTEPCQYDAPQSLRLMSQQASVPHRGTSCNVKKSGSSASLSQRSNQSLRSRRMPDYDTSSSETVYETTNLDVIDLTEPFFEREIGPNHRGFTSFKPSNP